MPWPDPDRPGSYEALRGPQSWGGSRREQWDREGQRLPAEERTCNVVQLHKEALHDETKVQWDGYMFMHICMTVQMQNNENLNIFAPIWCTTKRGFTHHMTSYYIIYC
jgi:hypothetical protein